MTFCIDCNKKIDRRSKRCYSCSSKLKWKLGKCKIYKHTKESKKKIGKANSGNFSHFYKNGNCLKKPKCINCDKELKNYYAKRCWNCYIKYNRGKNHPLYGKICKARNGYKSGYYKDIYMRSSWEIKYAKYLDKLGIKWLYEPKTFNLKDTTYTPDFYLPYTNEYIEIKGYWRNDAKRKFKEFKKIYNYLQVKLLDKEILQKLEVI